MIRCRQQTFPPFHIPTSCPDDIIPFDELPISHLPTNIFPSTFITTDDATPSSEVGGKLAKLGIADDEALSKLPPIYPVAALGGTFDHLHAGHKILLSMGAWIAKDKLIVGVTGMITEFLVSVTPCEMNFSLQRR